MAQRAGSVYEFKCLAQPLRRCTAIRTYTHTSHIFIYIHIHMYVARYSKLLTCKYSKIRYSLSQSSVGGALPQKPFSQVQKRD